MWLVLVTTPAWCLDDLPPNGGGCRKRIPHMLLRMWVTTDDRCGG